ncbi:MAG: hypothetical protein HIU86_07470 [Acidobacteria bacterium]|nr:hypothetical protein [Acidobacteriota bacterium]
MSEEPDAFLERLAAGARRASPDAVVEVERERTLRDRLSGQQGRAVAVALDGADRRCTLRHERGGWQGEIARVVGGIVIARERVPLGAWLDSFASEVAASAARSTGDAAAARRAYAVLGLEQGPGAFTVDRDDVAGGLDALRDEARSRLPDDAAAMVGRIVGLLQDALPRASGDAAALVSRTATVYLPDTLRAYIALPEGWARSGALRDGSSAADALRAQLASIEDAATRMRDAAVADDADALLLNGLFLEERFDA